MFSIAARSGALMSRGMGMRAHTLGTATRTMSTSRAPIGVGSWKMFGVTLVTFGAGAATYQYLWRQKEAASAAVREESAGTPLIGGPFTLVDDEGRIVTEKDFLGKYMLIYFGFTYCPDICPSELAKMDKVIAALDKAPDVGPVVSPVMVSVDPRRDSLAQLRHYKKDFNKRLVCLTGTSKQVEVAAKAYRVYYNDVDQEDEDDMDYVVDHSIVMYLMGPDGKFVDFFTQMMEPEEIVNKVKGHIKRIGK